MNQFFRLTLLLLTGLTAVFIKNTYVSNSELDELRYLHLGRSHHYF